VNIEGLHIHDLRREFACRLRESGAPDHEVAAWLGHANISTTSTYLKTNRLTLQKAAKRFERQRKLCKAVVNTVAQAAKLAASAGSKNRANVLN
jgi:integrase